MVGNIIIYQPGEGDEGLYQCMAANSEGVVFSRVVKVRMRKSQGNTKRGRALNNPSISVYLPLQASNKQLGIQDGDLHLVMGIKQQ